MADHPAGTPIWTDLATTNIAGAKDFYEQLLGWQGEDQGAEAGNYILFNLDGKMVAGGMATQNPQQPPAWMTYIKSDNADETAQKITENGGQIVMGPMDVMQLGRMIIATDPQGAFFGVWQPGQHPGAQIFNEPGAMGWNELDTRDIEGAKKFYPAVFGWNAETSEFPGGEYTEWKLEGRSIGGGMQMGEQFPPNVPSNWLVYFGVPEINAGVEKVKELGGNVIVPPMQIQPGWFAVVSDPQGAVFALWAPPAAS